MRSYLMVHDSLPIVANEQMTVFPTSAYFYTSPLDFALNSRMILVPLSLMLWMGDKAELAAYALLLRVGVRGQALFTEKSVLNEGFVS